MHTALLLATLALGQTDEALVFRGTAATAGAAAATFDINGCSATTSVNVAQNATAASTCTALANGLTGQCELDAARIAQLEARLAELQAIYQATVDEMNRVLRRLEQARNADTYVVFACGLPGANYRALGKLGGEKATLTSETVSQRGYEVRE